MAWIYCFGEIPDGLQIDHINGIKTDNRICNLRLVNGQSDNLQNICIKSNNKSGYTGVYFNKRDKVWLAQIGLNKKRKTIGTFATAKEAHEAYLIEKSKLHLMQPKPRHIG